MNVMAPRGHVPNGACAPSDERFSATNRIVVAIVVCCAVVRLVLAIQFPLTEDEAYYVQWSRHLAAGYIDHPPAVAWLIALFVPPFSPVFVRLGFVICGVVGGLALADTARILARRTNVDPDRAALATVCTFSLAPVTCFSFATAMPDGPYLAFWCVALWAAARVGAFARRRDMIVLGLALAGALLSRAFGFAIVAGIFGWSLLPAQRRLWKGGLWLTFAVVTLLYAPFLLWNATHDWANFAFSIHQRNEVHALRLSQYWPLVYGATLMYSPGLWFAALCALVASTKQREPLIASTAVPFAVLLTVLAMFETVEQHWYLGTYASLCVGMGLGYPRLRPFWRRVWSRVTIVPALGLLVLGTAVASAPEHAYATVRRLTHVTVRNDGPFEVYAYRQLARDVAALTAQSRSGVMTTSYGLAAELDYHRGLSPVVIGDDYRGRESRRWPLRTQPEQMLIIERAPLGENTSLEQALVRACKRLTPGPVLRYRFAGAPPRSFYTTYCIGIPGAEVAALRATPSSH
jgi:Dolichyl-phosphate-mannose-protein mannosyltransferase